jgi:hypothetical protein
LKYKKEIKKFKIMMGLVYWEIEEGEEGGVRGSECDDRWMN